MFVFARPTLPGLILGLSIAIVGEGIRLWGVSIVGSETRTTGTVGGTYLVTTGPFAYVRNPLYVGNLLLYIGIGVMSNALFPWLLLVATMFFFMQYSLIVALEEEYLRKRFSSAFEDYARRVPRFFPNFQKYKGAGEPELVSDFQRGLRSEARTFQALFLISAALIVLWQVRS
jgi:protein-S-isoprenylcysteine O-methyltransferase Ste14